LQREKYVLLYCKVGIKGIILKYQPDAAVFRRQVRNVVLAKEYASRRRGEQAGDEV